MQNIRRPRLSAADTVAEQLRRSILDGAFPPGELLPSEIELAERFQYSRLTIREAIKTLSSQGLVRVQQGMGTEVQDYRLSGSLDLLPALLRVRRGEDGRLSGGRDGLLRDLLEIRRILAASMIELACERATPADLRALRAEAEAQRERVDDPAAFAEGDLRFTRIVLGCCKNLAVELTFNTVVRAVDTIQKLVESMILHMQENLAYYELVIHMIEGGDGAAAREAASAGLREMDEYLLASIDEESSHHRKDEAI